MSSGTDNLKSSLSKNSSGIPNIKDVKETEVNQTNAKSDVQEQIMNLKNPSRVASKIKCIKDFIGCSFFAWLQEDHALCLGKNSSKIPDHKAGKEKKIEANQTDDKSDAEEQTKRFEEQCRSIIPLKRFGGVAYLLEYGSSPTCR